MNFIYYIIIIYVYNVHIFICTVMDLNCLLNVNVHQETIGPIQRYFAWDITARLCIRTADYVCSYSGQLLRFTENYVSSSIRSAESEARQMIFITYELDLLLIEFRYSISDSRRIRITTVENTASLLPLI